MSFHKHRTWNYWGFFQEHQNTTMSLELSNSSSFVSKLWRKLFVFQGHTVVYSISYRRGFLSQSTAATNVCSHTSHTTNHPVICTTHFLQMLKLMTPVLQYSDLSEHLRNCTCVHEQFSAQKVAACVKINIHPGRIWGISWPPDTKSITKYIL